MVTLNGSKSNDPAGGGLSYLWEQVAGPPVVLSNSAIASPTFTAPVAPTTLTFRLTVSGANGTDLDEVSVEVKAIIVNAPDTWFVGYGRGGAITATVSGGSGGIAYEWTGVEAWLTAGGTTSAALSYTVPALTDFQNFPDRAEVAVLERTTQGRLQLKVKVTDATGATDEDFVNFSVGPFSDSVANENVALGEPVFLNGGATNSFGTLTGWTWTGTKPTGASIAFLKPDKTSPISSADRFVYFVPDQLGKYEIIVSQTAPGGSVVKVINLTCGKFVGVGNLVGTTPDPNKGECAACHAGQLGWLADLANPWLQTGHAQMFSTIVDPSDPYHATAQAKGHWRDAFNFGSNYSIDSRTVGWSTVTTGTNDGWTPTATSEGYVFQGTTWEEMKRKFPKTAGRSNVQCESCHGPGSEHAGDTTAIRKSYDANLCGRCHSRKQDLWEAGPHGRPVIASPSGSASCNGCHTAQGFVVEMRAQEGAEPHPALTAGSNSGRPILPLEDRRGTTCQACHDPHKRTAKMGSTGSDPQLRAYGNVKFRNNVIVNAGEAAVCFLCHQSRKDSTAGSSDFNGRAAPHDSTAAEMLSSANAHHFAGWTYDVSPHGIAAKFIAPGKSENRMCLSCHVDVAPSKGQSGYSALGGHTFNMMQGTGTAIAGGTDGSPLVGTAKFTVAAGTFLKQVFAGDTLTLTSGNNMGMYTIWNIDTSRQLTVTGVLFVAEAGAVSWQITSVVKHNSAACNQCHTTAADFRNSARADYDGDGVVEAVQDEIAGLDAALLAAINAKLATLTGGANTLAISGGKVKYTNGVVTRTIPGPSVTSTENPDIPWSSLTAGLQAEWQALYQAAYNRTFVANEGSGGIHNTGYAVNLLQSSYKAVTGSAIGAAFVPFP